MQPFAPTFRPTGMHPARERAQVSGLQALPKFQGICGSRFSGIETHSLASLAARGARALRASGPPPVFHHDHAIACNFTFNLSSEPLSVSLGSLG